MPEKKEVRKTKPIARDPTIAEEKKRKKPQRKENQIVRARCENGV